jgi:hypothetical protein
MTEPATDPGSREDRVNAILAAYLDAVAAGQTPDRAELLARHPDLAAELTAFFAQDDQVRQLAEPRLTVAPGPGSEPPALPPGPSPVSPPLGRVRYFGDYELLEEMARGGMGVVYRARQVTLDRVVAVKTILAGQLAGPDDVRRFHQEARLAASLQHPGIVALHEVGEHEGQHYFSMDFIEGTSLAALVRDRAPAPRQAARYVEVVARAVHYAHQRGVLHRDLKPANVLIDRLDQPHVTDFGLARPVNQEARLTATGAVLGTPGYLAPEQVDGRSGPGVAADVYALGAVLYELLTGRPPFRGATVFDTLQQTLHTDPVPPCRLAPKVPRDLETVCLKCLEKDPNRRYASAADLADDLARFLASEPIQGRPQAAGRRAAKWLRRHPLAALLVAGVALQPLVVWLSLAIPPEPAERLSWGMPMHFTAFLVWVGTMSLVAWWVYFPPPGAVRWKRALTLLGLLVLYSFANRALLSLLGATSRFALENETLFGVVRGLCTGVELGMLLGLICGGVGMLARRLTAGSPRATVVGACLGTVLSLIGGGVILFDQENKLDEETFEVLIMAMYLPWALCTLVGALLGGWVSRRYASPDPAGGLRT